MTFAMNFKHVELVSQQLKVLSNPDRLKILCVLLNGALNVQEIEERTSILQPTLSQQLTALRKANMVATTRQGKYIYYQCADQKVHALIEQLHELYCNE